MKRLSLLFACIGIISTANSQNLSKNPQETGKVKKTEKIQVAPVQKAQKTEPPQRIEPASQSAEKKQNTQSVHPIHPKQPARLSSHKTLKKAVVAKPALKATPVPVEQQKK